MECKQFNCRREKPRSCRLTQMINEARNAHHSMTLVLYQDKYRIHAWDSSGFQPTYPAKTLKAFSWDLFEHNVWDAAFKWIILIFPSLELDQREPPRLARWELRTGMKMRWFRLKAEGRRWIMNHLLSGTGLNTCHWMDGQTLEYQCSSRHRLADRTAVTASPASRRKLTRSRLCRHKTRKQIRKKVKEHVYFFSLSQTITVIVGGREFGSSTVISQSLPRQRERGS